MERPGTDDPKFPEWRKAILAAYERGEPVAEQDLLHAMKPPDSIRAKVDYVFVWYKK